MQIVSAVLKSNESELFHGGRFVIGQELDSEEGKFSDIQSFHGEMSEMFMSNASISDEDALAYISCKPLSRNYATLYDFNNQFDKFLVNGAIDIFYEDRYYTCAFTDRQLVLSQDLAEFTASQEKCSRFGGSLYFPKSKQDELFTLRRLAGLLEYCNSHYSSDLWYGVVANATLNAWVSDSHNQILPYLNFHRRWGDISGTRHCTAVQTKYAEITWFSAECNRTACSICSFKKSVAINVIGLCEISFIETTLYLEDVFLLKWRFLGYFYTQLYWNGSRWLLENAFENTKLVMNDQRWTSIPLGRHSWSNFGDRCRQNNVSMHTWHLAIRKVWILKN